MVYTDVIQAVLMIITLVAGPLVGIIYIMNHPEGFTAGIPQALVRSGETYTSLTGGVKGFGAGLLITGGFSWFFGYLGGQPLSQPVSFPGKNRQLKDGHFALYDAVIFDKSDPK